MPSLKDLVCHVQWADTGSSFPEYGTVYGDGLVETYIAIPSHPQVFNICLKSRMFISEGLAMVVFIDGQYQCNRNRVNLQSGKDEVPANRSQIDFLVRQKEKPLGDGTYMGREWRFDDCNLVTQLPQGTDESHFCHLGEIEVLVLRCRGKHTHERSMSTSSSGEHSGVLGDDEGSDKSGLVAETQSDKAAEAEDAMGDGFGMGLFDGPADEPSLQRFPGDAPGDDYYGYWQPHIRTPARYGPREGPPHPPSFRPAFDEARRPRHYYHDSPPLAGYARPVSPPPRPPSQPERHVHFDYGNRRGPQYIDHRPRYDRRPHPEWEHNNRPEYTRTRPSSYHETDHRGGHNPYPDYTVPPEQGHYIYDAAGRTYGRHPEPRYGSYRPRSPPPDHPPPHAYAPPPGVYPHPASHPVQHVNGPPPLTAAHVNVPNPPATALNGPPVHPHYMPMQATHARPGSQVPAPPISYFVPNGMPPHMAIPPFPGSFPIYPPPGNHPLLHTQGPNNGSGQAQPATSAPPGNGQQQGDNNATNAENSNTGNDNVSDQKHAESNNNDGGNNNSGNDNSGNDNNTGDSNNNSWENSGNNDYQDTDWPTETDNITGNSNNNNNQQDTDWENNNNTNNNNGDGGWNNPGDTNNHNGDGGWNNPGDANGGDGGNNDCGNNDAGDNNNQSWETDNSHNQQGGNNSSWSDANQNNQNSGGANNQSNTWNNGQNSNPTPNNQTSNWNNENNQRSGSGSQPTPGEGQLNGRVLYGPYGPYYGAKSLAQKGPPPDSEEEPRYDLPREIAQSRGVTKQVQPGPGYLYVKKRCAPIYIDTLDEPYAKFVFKYRTKEQLKHEIGVDISGEPSGNEEVNALENLDKAELIQLVLRAKGALGGVIPEPPPRPTPTSMNEFQQISVPAPDMSYLSYSLPALRNVSNGTGLGIRYSSSSQANGGTPNQNNGNSGGGGDQGWANNNQQQSNNTGNNSGWDGAQEHRTSVAPSQHISGSSPNNDFQPRRTSMDDAHDAVFGTSDQPPMAYPPPPQPITFGPQGTTGGGQMDWKNVEPEPGPGTSVMNSEGGNGQEARLPAGGW